MKTRKFCRDCGRPLLKSDLSKTENRYKFQCFGCDKDFWRFEVYSTKEIETVRKIQHSAFERERLEKLPFVSFKRPYPRIKPK